MNSYSLKLPDPTYTDAMKKNELTTKNAIGDLDTYYLRVVMGLARSTESGNIVHGQAGNFKGI